MASTSHDAPRPWHVLISFRGKDTRNTFTSHLYAAFRRESIRTFMDEPELPRGEVISDALLKAIREAKTCVVVLSKNYASSKWCLDELVEILSIKDRLVLPVFYHVKPSAVEKQEETFNEAFKAHKSHSDDDKLNKWRWALAKVGKLAGYNVDDNSPEAGVVQEIVKRIVNEINSKTSGVADYPIGLDSHVEAVTALIKSSDPEKITKIGIHGMGGVGKTTLAEAVYNQIYKGFQASCFLTDIRANSGTNEGLKGLPQKLINYFLRRMNSTIDSLGPGTTCIEDRFYSTKVLIVIDDLDDPYPLEYLLRKVALGLGSIIITTRNEDLLDEINVDARYKVNELSDAESLQLFAKYAFKNDIIPPTFTDLTKDILQLAGGVPLALKYFGRKLRNKPDEEWGRVIDASQRVSIDEIVEELTRSFEGLKLVDPVLKDIFLDLACFFIGRKKEEVFQIMKTCYKFVNVNIDILKKRCLLTINNSDNTLGMHQLYRDMGRQIVRDKSSDQPGKQSRLWASKDICHVLKKREGTDVIEGIIPHNFRYEDALMKVDMDTFEKMSKLRFLYLENVNDLTGSFKQKFKKLKFLYWKHCPLEYWPPICHPEELVILELPHSKLKEMWKPNTDYQGFEKLKTLNLSYSLDLTTTPNFTKLSCLETLNLEGCKSLEEVHISIESSKTLVSLKLCGCLKLKSLPNICKLGALKPVRICGCLGREDKCKIARSNELHASGATPLKELPDTESSHITLSREALDVPSGIGQLSKIENLYL